MGDFPFLSLVLDLEESSGLLTVVIHGLCARSPSTLSYQGRFLHRCCFFAESDEFQRSQKLENCQQRACGSGKEKAAAGSTSPCGAPAVTSTSGRESLRKNGISVHELAPTWRSLRAMAETFGDEEGSQGFKGLWIKTMRVVYKRCFTKKRTQIARNPSPPLLPWYHSNMSQST